MRKYARRGVIANKDINKGEKISYKNIAFKRPSTFIPAENVKSIIGKKTLKKILFDQPIKLKYLIK